MVADVIFRAYNHENYSWSYYMLNLDYGQELQCLGGGLYSPSASGFYCVLRTDEVEFLL